MHFQKIAVFIDFDDTLLNVSDLIVKRSTALAKTFSIRQDAFLKTYEHAKDNQCIYSPEKHSQLIAIAGNRTDLNPKKILEHLRETTKQDVPSCIYPEVPEFLANIQAKKSVLDLFILSRGNYDYQQLKIQSSGLAKYFVQDPIYLRKKVYITQGSKGSIICKSFWKYQAVIIIDDKLDQLILAQKSVDGFNEANKSEPAKQLIPIWINRQGKQVEPVEEIYVFPCLLEALPLLSSIVSNTLRNQDLKEALSW